MHALSLITILDHLICYSDDESIYKLSQCSKDCHESIHQIKRRQLFKLIKDGNILHNQHLRSIENIESVHNEETLKLLEMIKRKEDELKIILPSYLKEFILICGDLDCRFTPHLNGYYSSHPCYSFIPFQEWEFLKTHFLKIPSRTEIEKKFKAHQRDSLVIVGYDPITHCCLLLESNSGLLYEFGRNELTKFGSLFEWYTKLNSNKTFKHSINNNHHLNQLQHPVTTVESAIKLLKFKSGDYSQIYKYLPIDFKKNEQLIMEVMKSGYVEKYIPFKYKDNADFMLQYIKQNLDAFQICSARLRYDIDFVKRVFEINPKIIYQNNSREWNFKVKPFIDV
ncbi:predicted protein [Naegleria gruberi]|uniref:Predicted protein n=1 Tax=Naegleria gruberi TaxID=5762 RepID=D2V5G9_NAEGR|nr:uncharacterized protein NAEGRDRAFT_63818 [Naegleria gruberi]EFC47947.1 predicted protein [Naegleria gruberi]|eukprot:XP_002680691.1 predicted protein [Naegleria gruberi strain NEG-M]